ncbi:MAG: hypothetical protein FWH11_12915 [Micrococcales bacterium]|nr:hypothetical protein [Micrococcales bacterium]
MSDKTTPEQPFVPQQKQPPSSEQLEAFWEQEEVTDFAALRDGLAEIVHKVEL